LAGVSRCAPLAGAQLAGVSRCAPPAGAQLAGIEFDPEEDCPIAWRQRRIERPLPIPAL